MRILITGAAEAWVHTCVIFYLKRAQYDWDDISSQGVHNLAHLLKCAIFLYDMT